MYNTLQLLLDKFIFCVFEKAFCSWFLCSFFGNALAGRRDSYQTRADSLSASSPFLVKLWLRGVHIRRPNSLQTGVFVSDNTSQRQRLRWIKFSHGVLLTESFI